MLPILDLARTSFAEACDESLSYMTVDGDTSTNGTVIVLASGASGVQAQ